jgi:hypothetical protein
MVSTRVRTRKGDTAYEIEQSGQTRKHQNQKQKKKKKKNKQNQKKTERK